MKETLQTSKEAILPSPVAGGASPARQRVLEFACLLFSEAGFHGTHLREVCKRAGVNIAGVCYYFHSKEGLYEAVTREAARRLSAQDEEVRDGSAAVPPEERLQEIVESLFEKLSGERAWIAKLLARELVDPVSGMAGSVSAGLEKDLVLLEGVISQLLGPRANRETARLHALSVVSQSVFYCLAGENLHHVFPQLSQRLPDRPSLARHVAQRALGGLGHGANPEEPTAEQAG